jgi:hypothetical protein
MNSSHALRQSRMILDSGCPFGVKIVQGSGGGLGVGGGVDRLQWPAGPSLHLLHHPIGNPRDLPFQTWAS